MNDKQKHFENIKSKIKVRKNQKQSLHESFGEYIVTMLDNIPDANIVERAQSTTISRPDF